MPGSVRIPVRPLTIDQQDLYAYPGEILIDPSTGLIKYLIDGSRSITNKNPGTLTVKSGNQNIMTAGDLSTDLTLILPSMSWEDIKPDAIDASMINGLTANRVLIGSATGVLDSSDISTTELGYLSGVTSNIQDQLNGKAASDHTHSQYLSTNGTAAAALKLANAVNISIGNSTKSFDGSSALAFTLSEIGAAAADHTHTGYLGASGGTITGTLTISGTLNVTGDATGIQHAYTGTLSTSWSGSSAPYTQTVSVPGILLTDRPTLDFTCSGTYATDQSREEGWLNVYRATTAANSITFYAHDKPTVAIPFIALVTR